MASTDWACEMNIVETIEAEDEPLSYVAKRYLRDGSSFSADDLIQKESQLHLYVNGVLTMKIGCSASNLAELVVGRLASEGLITSPDEISLLSINERRVRAEVRLTGRVANQTRVLVPTIPTSCTHDLMLNDFFGTNRPLRPVMPIAWSPEWVFRVADEFAKDKTAHARTRGVHSAYLATQDSVLCLREDIGRHNAFDKAIGWALLNDIDLTRCMLFTSGRTPADMVTKAIRAGIPVLASKAVATDKTIEMARAFNLTLISAATASSIDVLNDPYHADSPQACARKRTQAKIA